MTGIVIVGHGSRSLQAQGEFLKVVEMLKDLEGDSTIVGAHMELCEPSLPMAVEKVLENKEIKEIKIIPYFLYAGIHIKEDIPEIISELEAKHPGITFKFGKPLGAEIEIAKILHKRVKELN